MVTQGMTMKIRFMKRLTGADEVSFAPGNGGMSNSSALPMKCTPSDSLRNLTNLRQKNPHDTDTDS